MKKWSVGLPSIPVFPPRTDYRQPVDQTQGLLFQDGLGDHQGIRRRRIVWDIIQRQTSCTEFPDQRRISEEIRFSRLLGYFPSGKVNARTDPFPVRYEGQRHWHLLSSTASKALVHDHQHAQFARFQQASGQFSLQGLVIDVTQSASHPQGDQSAFTLRQEGDSCSLGRTFQQPCCRGGLIDGGEHSDRGAEERLHRRSDTKPPSPRYVSSWGGTRPRATISTGC